MTSLQIGDKTYFLNGQSGQDYLISFSYAMGNLSPLGVGSMPTAKAVLELPHSDVTNFLTSTTGLRGQAVISNDNGIIKNWRVKSYTINNNILSIELSTNFTLWLNSNPLPPEILKLNPLSDISTEANYTTVHNLNKNGYISRVNTNDGNTVYFSDGTKTASDTANSNLVFNPSTNSYQTYPAFGIATLPIIQHWKNDDEIIKITQVNNNILTIARGQFNTQIKAHDASNWTPVFKTTEGSLSEQLEQLFLLSKFYYYTKPQIVNEAGVIEAFKFCKIFHDTSEKIGDVLSDLLFMSSSNLTPNAAQTRLELRVLTPYSVLKPINKTQKKQRENISLGTHYNRFTVAGHYTNILDEDTIATASTNINADSYATIGEYLDKSHISYWLQNANTDDATTTANGASTRIVNQLGGRNLSVTCNVTSRSDFLMGDGVSFQSDYLEGPVTGLIVGSQIQKAGCSLKINVFDNRIIGEVDLTDTDIDSNTVAFNLFDYIVAELGYPPTMATIDITLSANLYGTS